MASPNSKTLAGKRRGEWLLSRDVRRSRSGLSGKTFVKMVVRLGYHEADALQRRAPPPTFGHQDTWLSSQRALAR